MTSRAEGGGQGEKVYDIVTMCDVGGRGLKVAWRHGVTSRTSDLRQGRFTWFCTLVRQFSQQKSFLQIRTLICYAYVANVSKHTKNVRCV